ncbi:hypothetical protein MKW92_050273, partial [Papaver armeniacum]
IFLFPVQSILGVGLLIRRARSTVFYSLRIGKITFRISTSNASQDLYQIIFLLCYVLRIRIWVLALFDFN